MPFLTLLGIGFFTGYLAYRKNRNPLIWAILGFIANIAAIGILLLLPPGNFAELTEDKENFPIKSKAEYDQSILDSFIAKDYISRHSEAEISGTVIAFSIAAGLVIGAMSINIVFGIIVGIIVLIKFSALRKRMDEPGFGIGVIIYVVYLGVVWAALIIVQESSNDKLFDIILTFVAGIVGFFILPKISSKAKQAAPFANGMASLGILIMLFQGKNNTNTDVIGTDTGTVADLGNVNDSIAIGCSDATLIDGSPDNIMNDNFLDNGNAFLTDTSSVGTLACAGFPSIFDSSPNIPSDYFSFDPNVLANASVANQPVTLFNPSGMQAMRLDNGIIFGADNSQIGGYEFNKAFDRNVFYDNNKDILFTVDSNGGYFDKDGVSIGKLDKLGAADVFMDNQQNITYKTINGTIFNGKGEIVGSVKV